MSRHQWTEPEIETLRQHYPHEPTATVAARIGVSEKQAYSKAAQLGVYKTKAYFRSPQSACIKPGERRARQTEFQSGHSAWNKGLNYQPGGRCDETQFQPGHKPHNWHPIGHERLTKEGYLQRKMTDTGVTRRDYIAVHHLIWHEAGREIPPGYALCFKDGDKTRIALDNLELVPRADLMRRNSVHNLPKELADLVHLRGVVQRQINKEKGKTNGQDTAKP